MAWFIPLLKLIGAAGKTATTVTAKKAVVAKGATAIGVGAFATFKGATIISTAKSLVVSSLLVWGGTELVDKLITESGYSKGQYSDVNEEMEQAFNKKTNYSFRICLNNSNKPEVVNEHVKFCPYDGKPPTIGKRVEFLASG